MPPSRRTAQFDANLRSDPRWAAVESRAASADGAFVYCVRTTGVYCRPSCGARRPRPSNVEFHDTPEAAERAGFRPCKRCTPRGESPAKRRAAAVAAMCRAIESSDEAPPLEELARHAELSAFHAHRVFKAVTGVTPRGYARALRTGRVRANLGRLGTVTAAVHGAGYNSSGRFYAEADAVLGMKTSKYRAGGAGEDIRFTTRSCSLGLVLVAATAKGVCAILLGDDRDRLASDLERRFPRARLLGVDRKFEQLVTRVVELVEEPRTAVALPLDIRGTAFQQRVWEALRKVPAGTTTNYAQLAAAIRAPKSVRAVAGACAANPLAVAIPCHRVVRKDGGLAGYRWGVGRKRALLERETQR